jgi:hypothetical protein
MCLDYSWMANWTCLFFHPRPQPLREYSLWTDAIKGALKRRDNFQAIYETSVEDLERKRADRALVSCLFWFVDYW